MNQNFKDFIQKYTDKPIAVAVSGGVDSVCLLCWLAQIHKNVVCLHVNHGLRAAADTETKYVSDLCKQLNVPCQVFYWTGEKPQTGLEAAARDARYKMMIDYCRENAIDYLMVAHQADDQIETFLMNLGRGSGIYGLAAMKTESVRDGIKIVRPLLSVSRAEIKKYCDDNNIKYFADEMNDDTHYTRVNIRKNRHVLSDTLGISDARLLLAIENLGRLRDALDNDIDHLITSVCHKHYAMFSDSFLFDLSPDIRLKLLGTLIQKIGGDNYQPRLKSLACALDKLSQDTQFTLGHCTIRRLKSKILIVPEGDKTTFRTRHEKSI
ncbi:MAG: tRNA lysidine(34) synthetase TilS [Proteobacteria bacterium]|nr:tRNA lysidine(34) synthetase TilS [Candidatus Enterousia scatequi]